MTLRMDKRFEALKREGRPALVTYFMGGDPDFETALDIMKALPKAGADVIELGMPFSDPMADGPSIQAAGLRALKAGTAQSGWRAVRNASVNRSARGSVNTSSRGRGLPSGPPSGTRQFGYSFVVPGWFWVRFSPTASVSANASSRDGERAR